MTQLQTIEVIEEQEAEDFTSERTHKQFTLRRFDPFGFIKITFTDKPGPRPPDLSGDYTDFTSAVRDIDAYLSKIELLKKTPIKPKA